MRIDLYTRVMLTIIAACLVWLSFGGPSLVAPAHAQQTPSETRVLITGWIDDKGITRKLPECCNGNLPVWVANR
jgi:hypothetical protein